MFNVSSVINILKKYDCNPKRSDEESVNDYLNVIALASGVTNRLSDEFHLNKARSSDLLRNKINVPKSLIDGLSSFDVDNYLCDNIKDYLDKHIDSTRIDDLKQDLVNLLESDDKFIVKSKQIATFDNIHFWNFIYKNSITADNIVVKSDYALWKNGNNSVSVVYGDIFKYSFENRKKSTTISVIPVNTSFDTHISRKYENDRYPLVSENSIHGKWLNRLYGSGVFEEQIYENITADLSSRNICSISERMLTNGRSKFYPSGTISIYEHKNNLFYLLALSEFNEKNNAHSNVDTIKTSIKNVLNEYNESGQGYNLYIPLLGTGLSRAGMSFQESYDVIIDTIKNNLSLVQGKINIVIYPSNKDEIKIWW